MVCYSASFVHFASIEFRVVASPSVVEMLLDEESAHLAALSEFVGKPISLSAESAMNAEQHDIVLV
jgi:ribonuclease G